MYIVSWLYQTNRNLVEVTVSHRALFSLTTLLENNKIRFSVSDTRGRVEPDMFGYDGYEYWMKNGDRF